MSRAEGGGSAVRTALFKLWVYTTLGVLGLLLLPLLAKGRRGAIQAIRIWSKGVLWGLKVFAGGRVEVRGLEHRPAGAALIGAKHQSMLDTILPFAVLDDPCFVLKSELTKAPVFGWYAARAGMIPVERAGHSAALRAMLKAAKLRLAEPRQVVIFPEGTRQAVGAPPDYKPGIMAIYRELGLPCAPLATNSGLVWPAKGRLSPGVAVFEFLPVIPPGLPRAEFMHELQARLDEGSDRLVAEALSSRR